MRQPQGGMSGACKGVASIVLIDFDPEQVGFRCMAAHARFAWHSLSQERVPSELTMI